MPRHRVLGCVEELEGALKEVLDVPVVFMGTGDKRAALLRLARVESQLAGLRLRLMAVADDVALEEGARDVAALVAHHTRDETSVQRRALRLAEGLDRRWERTGAALGRGA